MDTLIQAIIRWIQRSDKKMIIGISGHGAAGKTTFAANLIEALKIDVNYLNTDPYIVSSAIRKYAIIDYTYDEQLYRSKMTACHPAAHHVVALERDLKMLKEGMNLRTIDTHYVKGELLQAQNNVTIVEGMSVAFTNLEFFDLLIYFYTDGETEFERRLNRDLTERGIELHYLKQSHHARRIQYELFMHPYREHFDIIIKSHPGTLTIEKNTFDFNWI